MLRCATPEEYWLWQGCPTPEPPASIPRPSRGFCADAGVAWCREQRADGRCHLSDGAFRRTIAGRLAGEATSQRTRPVQLDTAPLHTNRTVRTVSTFAFPSTGTIHAADMGRTRATYCGIDLGGFQRFHPEWTTLFAAVAPASFVTCRSCRRWMVVSEVAA